MAKVTAQKTKVNYIDNQKFLDELLTYLDACKLAKADGREDPPIPPYIGDCFLKIATNLARAPNFCNYSYKDEMIMDGVENCLMYFKNFDPSKSKNPPNPFGYFTQFVWYAFVRRIGKEKKQSYIKYKMTEQFGIDGELEMVGDDDLPVRTAEALYDNMSEYIHTFEEKMDAKKQRRRKKDELPEDNGEES
jgi:hypothetical protein